MRLILIRHGQTDWNLEKRVQGRTDMPLNAQGIRQAELVAKAVLRYPVERIYASSLERAWETAEIVRQAFLRGIPGTEPRKIPEVIRIGKDLALFSQDEVELGLFPEVTAITNNPADIARTFWRMWQAAERGEKVESAHTELLIRTGQTVPRLKSGS